MKEIFNKGTSDIERPSVVVLLAAYCGIKWIENQIYSILRQKSVCVSIYISIDIGPDGTEEWCRHLAEQHENVFILSSGISFGSAGKNFFRLIKDVDFSDYSYFAFADQDDIWDEDKLIRAVEAIEKQKLSAYSSNVTAVWADGKKKLINKSQKQVKWDYFFEAAGPGCTYVFPKSTALKLKSNVTQNWEKVNRLGLHDWYCYAFVRSYGGRWFIDPAPSMSYRQHPANQMGANIGWASMRARWKLIRDGWWLNQITLVAELIGDSDSKVIRHMRGSLFRRLRLACMANQCRRRVRDKFFFALACIICR